MTDTTDAAPATSLAASSAASSGAPLAASRRPRPVVRAAWHLPIAMVLLLGAVLGGRSAHPGLALLGVGAAVAGYLTLRRWAVWSWLAALVVVPAALGTDLLDLPSGADALATTWLAVGVTAGLVVAMWRARSSLATVALVVVATAAGLLAAWATDVHGHATVSWSAPSAFFVLALPGAVGLVAAAGVARADRSRPLRWACALMVVSPLAVLLVGGDAYAALVWWPAAGALGVTAMLRGRRGAAAAHPQTDAVDRDAVEAFDADGPPRLPPVAIVIAAYNEATGLPDVLATLPREVCGLAAEVLVVDDGSTDGTAAAARAATAELGHGHVVACGRNRGQGAALRLGYLIARTHGASYVLTTDADGQYDIGDLPSVLAPVLDGRADFVTGSRRLGALHNHDRVRQLGTHVFAWLASALLGRYLTDTSFGLRAMTAEVTAAVTLNQPQYQSSELLVGAASHGFRVLEVAGTMHTRAAGSTKKGGNLVYGSRYGRVMVGTWWREGAPAPVTEVAPALVGHERRDGGRARLVVISGDDH